MTTGPFSETDVVSLLLRVVICGGYFWSGVAKLLHFEGALREFSFQYKFRFPRPMLVGNIAIVIIGSVMMVIGWKLWISAAALGLFTFVATLLAYQFWKLEGRERMQQMFTFLEHVSLVGAFLLIAWQDYRHGNR